VLLLAFVQSSLFFCTAVGGERITVVSREAGSGTRGAFVELFDILDKDKRDQTTRTAEIMNGTGVMMNSVAGDRTAIGYVSLGALNPIVKPVAINGVLPSAETVKDKTYPIARPFLIAVKGEPNADAQDFINFILSKEGQDIVAKGGYIALEDKGPYAGKSTGRIRIGGSSSVTPIMEKLVEAYLARNKEANIEIQQNDSSTGMNNTISGNFDIGMASRDLRDSEKEKGLIATEIAIDGIALIVHKENTVKSLTKEQVKAIFTGEIRSWTGLR